MTLVPLRVLIVDDSAYGRWTIADILSGRDDIEVIGKTGDGDEALRLVAQLEPGLITLDLEMPRMDGFTFLRVLMVRHPTPVIVVSELAPDDGGDPHADLVLASASRRVALRFWSPRQIEIEEGEPSAIGMEILDVSARGLDGVSVRVDNHECSGGALRFVARALEIIRDEQPDAG